MPGHASDRRNECADRLDGISTLGIGRAMDWADILYAIREAGRAQEENSNCESATLNNLQEQKVKRGCGETTALFRQSKKICKPTNWMLVA